MFFKKSTSLHTSVGLASQGNKDFQHFLSLSNNTDNRYIEIQDIATVISGPQVYI